MGQMKYRGQEYEALPLSLEILEGDMVGCYRGQMFHPKYVKHLPEASSEFRLRYRGATYVTGGCVQGVTQTEEMAAALGSTLGPTVSEIVPLRRKIDSQLSQAHHSNLVRNIDRRLQVARSQGNTQLVQALEAERELL